MTITELEKGGFVGVDASLRISIAEYGIAWADRGDEWIVLHRASHGAGYDFTYFSKSTDVLREYDWADWPAVRSYLGIADDEAFALWLALPLPVKLNDLTAFYGVQNIYGDTYFGGTAVEGLF